LQAAFAACGVTAGQTLMLHSSLKAVGGWLCGGAVALIHALQAVLTPDGTLMMPTQTGDLSDPAHWQNPPVAAEWWQSIRAEMPAYDPAVTPTWNMGIIPETFRRLPHVLRSEHPLWSCAAWGKHAEYLTREHTLAVGLGEGSPIAKLYEVGGAVLLLGVDHGSNTTLHLAEYRANFPKPYVRDGAPLFVNGVRQWVEFEILDLNAEDFVPLGSDFEAQSPALVRYGKVGNAVTRLLPARPLVDFGVDWLTAHRGLPTLDRRSI
jgi:aminoglycoside 3-N-acetyltransferase